MHPLNYLMVPIRHLEGIQVFHEGLQEGFHKIFKSVYAKGSHARRFAMDETVIRYNKKLHNNYLSSRKGQRQTCQNQCIIYAMSHDSGMMIFSGVKTTFAELKSLLPLLSRQIESKKVVNIKIYMFHSDMLKLGQERFRALRRLLDEHLPQLCKDATGARHVKMIFAAAAYIFGTTTSTVDSIGDGDAATFKSSKLKLVQRLVGREQFYETTEGHYDTLFVVKEILEAPQRNRNIQ